MTVKPLATRPGFNSWVIDRELLMDRVLMPSETALM